MVLALAVWGCASDKAGKSAAVSGSSAIPRPVSLEGSGLSYSQIVRRYNSSIESLDRLWSRAVVEVRWEDDRGSHFEQGEGNFIFVRPDRVALSVGKLGHTLFWIGANRGQYWMFDLREEKTVYAGRRRSARGRAGDLPIPVRPMDLPRVLGLYRINPDALPAEPQVEWYDGGYLIEPPGTRSRLLLDPVTFRPKRIDLLDEEGNSRLIGRLSGWETVQTQGLAPGGLPVVASRAEIALVDRAGRATLHLSDLSDGRDGGRITGKAFDLDQLIKALKPTQRVDLDRASTGVGE